LAEAVRRGRTEEFRSFGWKEEIPDPQAESTFDKSRLSRELAQEEPHGTLLRFYQMLLRFRREYRLGRTGIPAVTEVEGSQALVVFPNAQQKKLAILLNFADAPTDLRPDILKDQWEKKIDSSDLEWLGPGTELPATFSPVARCSLRLQPRSFAVFERTAFPTES